MKLINLLPYKERQKRIRQAYGLAAVCGLVIGLLAAGGLYGSIAVVVSSLKESTLAASPAQVQAPVEADPKITVRVAAVNKVSEQEVDWNKAFALVGTLIPQGVTLSSYSYGQGQNGVTLKMGGHSVSNAIFAGYIEALRTNQEINALAVDSYSYLPSNGSVDFSLSMQVPSEAFRYLKLSQSDL